MADDQTFHDDIEGYAGRLSYRPGDRVTLHVSTRATQFDVAVERWGATREPRWHATDVEGTFVAPPPDADAVGCRWPATVEFVIGDDWQSGFHLVTLTAHGAPAGRDVAHACFVVRGRPDDPARPRALYVLDTNTWHAYNTWGGRSLYTGGHTVSHARPFGRGMLSRPGVERDDRKARPVRWGEEPDVDGAIFQAYRTEHDYPAAIGSTGWFTHARRFVEWAERSGYRFDYAVSSDLELHPDALAGYDTVISVGHDEYWSAGQRRAVEEHVRGGGSFVSFSGNTMFWQVRLEQASGDVASDIDGDVDGDVNMVCHKYGAHLADPVVADGRPDQMTGMWADPLVGRPEWELLGAGSAFGLYHRFGQATPRGVGGFVVYRNDHWMLEGTGLGYGDVLGADEGVVGYETLGCPLTFDDLQLPIARSHPGLPADIEIVAFTPSSNLVVGEYPASISALSDQGDAEFIATRLYGDAGDRNLTRVRHGNAVMLTCRPFGPDGGEVVTVGTTDWVFGLASDAAVARVTANVLDHTGV
ncbi:MAG: N,N-dimethylformamidase beta subunit family domain-containing protein [Ilumatobacteraceae bacterium]